MHMGQNAEQIGILETKQETGSFILHNKQDEIQEWPQKEGSGETIEWNTGARLHSQGVQLEVRRQSKSRTDMQTDERDCTTSGTHVKSGIYNSGNSL